MEIFKRKNIEVKGKYDKPILADIFFSEGDKPKSIIIFCHGNDQIN